MQDISNEANHRHDIVELGHTLEGEHFAKPTMKVDPSVAAVFDSLFDASLEEEFQRVLGSHNFDSEHIVRPLIPNLKKTVSFAECKPRILSREPSHEDLLAQLRMQETAMKKIVPGFEVASGIEKKVKGDVTPTKSAAVSKASGRKTKRENPLICEASKEVLEMSVQNTKEKHRLLKRKSEDWNFKPHSVHRKRLKWEKEELTLLWQGIAQHGNNWTAIKNMVGTRSYCQIKDKGRRALFLLGWQTGRSKTETDSSGVLAKRIAEEVLAGL